MSHLTKHKPAPSTPLGANARRQPRARPDGPLEPDVFGGLVGTVDHVTLNDHDGPHPDDNHVYIWLKIAGGPLAGRYECAFNTQSDESKTPVQYCIHEEDIDNSEFPSIGFTPAEFSYAGIGLSQKDFQPIINGTLRSLVFHYAQQCNLVAAYGVTYTEGNGLHDIHLNSGEPKGGENPNRTDEDGVLVFYFRHETASSRRAWIFIKFATQSL